MYYSRINLEAEKTAKRIVSILQKFSIEVSNNSLISWIEDNFNCKIKVNYASFSTRKCSGVIYPKNGGSSYDIWINTDDIQSKQNFTLAHELAHIIGGVTTYGFSKEDIGDSGGIERFCDRFAAAFLMPEEKFKKVWKVWYDNFNFKKYRVAQFFGVSVEAVHYRAKELELF